ALSNLADPCPHRGDQRRADGGGDPPALQVGEEVLAPEALVGTQQKTDTVGQPAQPFVQEPGRAGQSAGVAVAELRVQPLARLADKAEQAMPADLARVGAARPLPRADRTVMLDIARVEVERHRRP